MKVQSLYFKLICIYGTVVALLVLCVGIILYQIIEKRTYQTFDKALIKDARFFVSRIRLEQDHLNWSSKGLDLPMSAIMRELEPHVVVTDFFGKTVYENTYNKPMTALIRGGKLNKILKQRSGLGNAIADGGARFRFVSFEFPSGTDSTPLIIHIGRPLDRLMWVLSRSFLFYIYSVPFMILLSIATGWLIANRVLRPFKDIAKAAEKISSENLNIQISAKYKEEEVQTLVKSFNAMVDRLNRSFQQMRTFNADAAHELRTPLSILRGETELLLKSANAANEEIKVGLSSNLEELDRLTRIVNDMLMLSEAEAGEQILLKKPIHLKTFIEDLIEHMRTLAATRGIQIRLIDVPDAVIVGDMLLIHRAIFNILDNAIKYSKDRGNVEITAAIKGAAVRLQIRDYGIGISSTDLPYIFDRLFRADRARNRNGGGIGLGLSIARCIIEAHQGNIQVISNLDQGTTFEIVFPVKSGVA